MADREETGANEPLLSRSESPQSQTTHRGVVFNENGAPGPNTGPCSSRTTAECTSSNLSFFDDYDVVGGIPRTVTDTGNAYELGKFKFSRDGSTMAAVDDSCAQIWVFDLFNRRPADCIAPGTGRFVHFCFQDDPDEAILSLDESGELCKWERAPDGSWDSVAANQMPFSCIDRELEFSDNGDYLAVGCNAPGGGFIAWYDITGGSQCVTEMQKVDLDAVHQFHSMQFSPSGNGFMLRLHTKATLVWPDYAASNVAFDVIGELGRWLNDEIFVTRGVMGDSYIWKVESLMSAPALHAISGQIMTYNGDPDCTVKGYVVGISGERIFVYEGNRMSVWNAANGSKLGDVQCKLTEGWLDSILLRNSTPMSKNGKWITLLEDGGKISVWDAHHLVRVWETPCPVALQLALDTPRLDFAAKGNKLVFAIFDGRDWMCHVYHLEVLEGEDELAYEIPSGFGFSKCKFSKDGDKIGLSFYHKGLSIWSLNSNVAIPLMMQDFIVEDFCFSMDGHKVGAISENGLLVVWDVEGKTLPMKQPKELCNVQKVAFGDDNEPDFTSFRVSFTCSKSKEEVLVVLANCRKFVWVEMGGGLMFTADVSMDYCNGSRFSMDGERCVVFCKRGGGSEAQVWDMVECKMLNVVKYAAQGALSFVDYEPQQLSLDGQKSVVGIQQSFEPWIINHVDAVDGDDFKKWDDCAFHDYGQYSIAGPIAAVSEDGQHVATCVRMDNVSWKVTVQKVDGDAHCASSHTFCFVGEASGDLLVSNDGLRVAWITRGMVRVWMPRSDDHCIPNYHMLRLNEKVDDQDELNRLLDMYGKNFLTFPNGQGWTVLSRAIQDRNTRFVRVILELAKANGEVISLNRSNLSEANADGWNDLLELVLDVRLPECVQVLMDETLNGSLVAPKKEEILRGALAGMISVYPRMVVDALCDSRMLQTNGEIDFPHHILESKPFLVRTSNDPNPQNLEEQWTKPIPSLAKPYLWGFVKNLNVWHKKDEIPTSGKVVPAKSFMVPIANFAKVGQEGLLSKVLGKGMDANVFRALPMTAMVEFKWSAFGHDLVYDNMCFFVLLLCTFSVYSLLLGEGCRHSTALGGGYGIACGLFLVFSMAMSALGLFSELKQLTAYLKERRGVWFYWISSKWNALEFLTYILIMFVIPPFHFATNACDCVWGISWAVPLVDVLLWWKVLYYAQAFRSTGPMVLMIFAIIRDILFFLIIGLGVLLGFGMGFFVLFRGDDEETFGNIGRSLLATFTMMLGDFDLTILYGSHAPIVAISLFVAYIFVMAIVLLNLLIAIMGDSFARIKESEEQHFHMVRAAVIDDMESMLSERKKQQIGKGIQRYLNILLPRDNIEEVGEWHGRMMELQNRFEEIANALQEKQQDKLGDLDGKLQERDRALNGRIHSLEDKVQERTSEIRGSQESILERIAGIEKKLTD